jgi:hypothetical protein
MKPVGGYFELELAKGRHSYHETPWVLKSGRSSLHYIFSIVKPSLVYVPYYTCDGLLESFTASGVQYRFYEIDETLEPVTLPKLAKDEYFLYINYFDCKRQAVNRLSEKYGEQLIVDATQAFFMQGNGKSWFFNSCRKFFGVPDGSYLYPPKGKKPAIVQIRNEKYITEHLVKRFNGHTTEGYALFVENEILCGAEIIAISKLSEYLLSNVKYAKVTTQRRANYEYLHQAFQHTNLLSIKLHKSSVPMCYPLLLKNIPNRELLYANKVFVPTFWKEVTDRITQGFTTEKSIAQHLLPIPVDHRYGHTDMKTMIKLIKSML